MTSTKSAGIIDPPIDDKPLSVALREINEDKLVVKAL